MINLFLIACAGAQEGPTTQSTSAEPIVTDPVEAAEVIEEAATPEVQVRLEVLRQTVAELHGEETVDRIMKEREEALEAAAVELAAKEAKIAKQEKKAIEKAVEKVEAEPDVIQSTDTAKRE